jgi:transposase
MEHIGLDLGKTSSQICILTEEGELIEKRIKTERESFAKVIGGRGSARILVEASTESEWVAECLEGLGQEVIVADPNFAPMYATRSKRIKTDKRDARALCEACRLGAYRKAHRTSTEQRHIRAQLSAREALVGTRTKYIVLIKSLLSRAGWRIPSGSSATFGARVKSLQLSAAMREEIAALLVLLEALNEQIAKADKKLEELVESDAAVKLLTSMPGVGKVTASAFVAAIDGVARFDSAKQVGSYFGLVPREFSSGEKQMRGRLSKAGSKRVRSLLVEVAWGIICRKEPATEDLRTWALKIAGRRGRKIAAVALARKLAGILYAMLRDGTEFSRERVAPTAEPMLVAA